MCDILRSGVTQKGMNHAQSAKLAKFVLSYPLLKYKKHETIIRAGEEPVGIYFIQKGYVRLHTVSHEGKELTLLMYREGDLFPALWIFDKQTNEYYFEALTAVEVRRCHTHEMQVFIDQNADVNREIEIDLIEQQRLIMKRLELIAFESARSRILISLRVLGRQFGRRIGNSILIPIPLTHRDLAAYTGMTRETASLEIEQLQREKVIRHRGRYFVIQK